MELFVHLASYSRSFKLLLLVPILLGALAVDGGRRCAAVVLAFGRSIRGTAPVRLSGLRHSAILPAPPEGDWCTRLLDRWHAAQAASR